MTAINNTSTILISDIVGYSKLSGDNQEVALQLLKEHDKILFDSISKYDAKILKNRGDGVIAQFDFPHQSLEMAVSVQRQFKRRNELNIKSRNLNVRIGIHYGEYIEDGNDLHGDCINIASKLEPACPVGGIVISSELCKQVIDLDNIYIREYKEILLNDKKQMTYEVYLDLIDWYKNKSDKKSIISSKKNILKKAHVYYNNGNYSAALKFSILAYEKIDNDSIDGIELFIVNNFISIGELEIAKTLLDKISLENIDSNTEIKAQFLKLKGHMFFNNKQWTSAKDYYKGSMRLFNNIQSKYYNEVLFYFLVPDIINETKILELVDYINEDLVKDDYYHLIVLVYECLKNKSEYPKIDMYIELVEKFGRNDLKAYGYWFINKLFFLTKEVDQAFIYETKAQENIKSSSKDISDFYLQNNFLTKLVLNKIITSESTIEVDDLFSFDEEDIIYNNQNSFFNYCVNCGKENLEGFQNCADCESPLFFEFYDKK